MAGPPGIRSGNHRAEDILPGTHHRAAAPFGPEPFLVNRKAQVAPAAGTPGCHSSRDSLRSRRANRSGSQRWSKPRFRTTGGSDEIRFAGRTWAKPLHSLTAAHRERVVELNSKRDQEQSLSKAAAVSAYGTQAGRTYWKRATRRIDLCGQIHSGVAQTSQRNFGSRPGFYESAKLCPARFILLKFRTAAVDTAGKPTTCLRSLSESATKPLRDPSFPASV